MSGYRLARSSARVIGLSLLGVATFTVALSGTASGAPHSQQLGLAAAGAVKLVVRSQGWVRVTQPQLVAAGIDARIDPSRLQLFADGVEHALVVTGNGDATFTAEESIEFFGTARDTLSTDAHTYWLVVGATGARVPVQAPAPGGTAPASFAHVERLVGHKTYLAAIRNGDVSNFFSAAVSATPATQTLTVRHLDVTQAAQAVLRVTLQGVTATAHAVDVSLGSTLLGTCTLDAQSSGTFSFPATSIVEGDNTITLVGHASASDYTAVASVELAYAHTYAADDDALVLAAPAATRLTIAGFSTSNVRVVDVTDEAHPVELMATVAAQGGANAARVDVPAGAGTHTLYAFTGAQVVAPASVTADAPSSWAASHEGELVILSHASFLAAMAPLVARRQQEGWTVQLVDLQDVYDEFGFGDKDPGAIRAFLQATRSSWRVPPRFVLLVGDATFDPRNFLGLGDFDFAPTKLIDTETMETVSDDWFVDADLDGVPEMAIGRMPVRTADQAAAVVAKTLAYAGTADLTRGGLFVTDEDGVDLDFTGASAAAEAAVSDIMPVDRFHRGDTGSTADVLLGKLGAGPFLVNYIGHGSVEVWDSLLTSAQASALTNTHASIYVVMNCLNGFFHDLYTTSLAEALLEAPNGGAVAVWASSTLAEFAPQPAYNQEFLMHLSRTSLGESAIAAKQAITDLESRRTWLLFGDPTLFGAPHPLPPVDAGADASLDAGTSDATGAAAQDAGAEASSDGGTTDGGDAASDDGPTAMDAAGATPDAGPADASDATGTKAMPGGGGGCGCAIDATATPTSALGLLVLGCIAATIRRRARRTRRRGRWPLALLTLALGWLAATSTAHAAYSYRKAITLDRTRIGNSGGATTLTNYPLLLNITDTALATAANGGHVQSTSGFDISFQGADATTCGGPSTCTFNYEVEQYTATTGQIVVWVQIPALKTAANTANTVIYVKYGDASVVAATQNVTGTWDTNFKGVFHLQQTPPTAQSDSTSTAASASSNGTPAPTSVTGKIVSAVNTSTTTGTAYLDYRNATFNWLSTDAFTYSGWFNTADSYGPLVSQRNNGNGNPVIDLGVGYDGVTNTSGALQLIVRDDSGGTNAEVKTTTTLNDSAWHFFTFTRAASGGLIELYVDGVSAGTSTNTGAASSITTGATGNYQRIGAEGNWIQSSYGTTDQQYLAASFDEYRISKTVRSSDWIITDYKTQSTPASTFSLGAETLASCGDGTRIAGEACDDGNIVSGDGCSSTCATETGYSCTMATPNVCSTTCGDGVLAASEACDDGNVTDSDGCSSTCVVETPYVCSGSPSVCKLATFDYYKTVVIDHTKVGTATAPATLTNYPVLFSITDPNLAATTSGGHVRSATANDLIFRGIDSTTCGGPSYCTLAHEIESYTSTSGNIIAWVNVPGLKTKSGTTDTNIRIMYGNQAIAQFSTTTQQPAATWDSNFKGVWHLNQSPAATAPQMTDSTTNANHGTSTGLGTATGEMGSGVSTDGSTSYMSFNSGTSLNIPSGSGMSASTWVKTTDAQGAIFSFRQAASGQPVIDVMVGADGSMTSSGSLLGLVRDSGGTLGDVPSAGFNNGAWHFVTITRNGTTVTLYLDGVSKGTATTGTGTINSDLRNLGREGYWTTVGGGFSADQQFLAATFDELRISTTARSIDWVTTDYNEQVAPSTVFSYSGGEITANAVTEVAVSSLDARETCDDTAVTWQTTYEVDTLGFNVFREIGGQRVQINPALIPGASVSGNGSGRQYQIVDPGSFDAGRTYWIEDVHFNLESTWYGPVAPTSDPSCGATATIATDARPAPAPLVSTSAAATDGTDAGVPDQLGGCTVAAGGPGGVAGALLLGLLTLTRRRRR